MPYGSELLDRGQLTVLVLRIVDQQDAKGRWRELLRDELLIELSWNTSPRVRFFVLTLVTGVRVFQGGIKQVGDVAKVDPATPVMISELPCECEVRGDGPCRARECQPRQMPTRVPDISICPDPF